MRQEDKELLLRDLCGRLPYGVKIKTSYDKIDEPMELIFINPRNESFTIGGSFTLISGLDFDIYECKPYLFPLSNMTEEQKKEFPFESSLLNAFINGYISLFEDEELAIGDVVKMFEQLNKNHFDYRGLIEKGLAIDCTNLNIY